MMAVWVALNVIDAGLTLVLLSRTGNYTEGALFSRWALEIGPAAFLGFKVAVAMGIGWLLVRWSKRSLLIGSSIGLGLIVGWNAVWLAIF